jgi:hypothetical protein
LVRAIAGPGKLVIEELSHVFGGASLLGDVGRPEAPERAGVLAKCLSEPRAT